MTGVSLLHHQHQMSHVQLLNGTPIISARHLLQLFFLAALTGSTPRKYSSDGRSYPFYEAIPKVDMGLFQLESVP